MGTSSIFQVQIGDIEFEANRLEFGIKKNRRCEGGQPGGQKAGEQKAGKIFTAELAETAEKDQKIVGWLRQKTANDKKQEK